MGDARSAVRGWIAMFACCLGSACAADAGDPLKSVGDDSSSSFDSGSGGDSVSGDDTLTTSDDTSIGDDTSTPDSGSPTDTSTGTPTDSGGSTDTGTTTAPLDTGSTDSGTVVSDSVATETRSDSGCDLSHIPSSCPDCVTGNPSDHPICEKYIACYMAKSCNPKDLCGTNDGVCGVNTLGGGEAPHSAAVTTYKCACP